jgi:2-polyprenyl-3-methyl-5-hydroxy-6-metoxy-1,4-benzoquinol methylase
MESKKDIKMITLTSCILCGSGDLENLYEVESEYIEDNLPSKFQLQQCKACRHTFVNPRPETEELMKYYPSDCPNYASSHETGIEKIVKKPQTEQENPKNKQKFKILDVGFGQGDYLVKMAGKGCECYGTDPSEHAVKVAQEKNPDFKLFCGDVTDAKYPDNFFDRINLTHVLEHVPFPPETLKELYRVLKLEGIIYIEVPNYAGIYYSLAKKAAEYFVPQHLSFFTPTTLEKALIDAGFADISISTSPGNNMSYHILHKLGIQRSFYKKSILNQLLGLFIVPFEMFLNWGDVVICDALKK